MTVTLITSSILKCAATTTSVTNTEFKLRVSDDAVGSRNNTQHAPVSDISKRLSKWISYANGTEDNLRTVSSSDGTDVGDDVGHLPDENLPVDVLGELLKGAHECLTQKDGGREGEDLVLTGPPHSVTACLKTGVLRNLEEWARRGRKRLDVLGGWLALERTAAAAGGPEDVGDDQAGRGSRGPDGGERAAEDGGLALERTAAAAGGPEDVGDHHASRGSRGPASGERAADDGGLIAALDALTRRYALRVQVFSDVGVRLARSSDAEDAVDYSVESLHEDCGTGREYGGGGGGHKKKKGGKKSQKKELEQLRKKMLLMMVPMAVQAVLLPLALLNMKMMLLKALLAGKLAIALILFNAARSGVFGGGGEGDAFQQQVAAEHYGYGGGVEYPAMFGRRDSSPAAPWRPRSPASSLEDIAVLRPSSS